MASYAVLDENNVVIDIISGRDEHEVVDGISDWEAYYSEIVGRTCKRTSFNTKGGVHLLGGEPFRMNFAEPNGTYDPELDAFIPERFFQSWTLNTETCLWDAPVPYPDDGLDYVWDEDTVSWVQIDAGS